MRSSVLTSANYTFSCGWYLAAAVLAAGMIVPSSAVGQQDPGSGSGPVVTADASPESLFVDFLHYARLGRFTVADAYATALLAHPNLDPAHILEVASRDKKSVDTLLIIIKNSSIGDNAKKVLGIIQRGEELKRKNPDRIEANIANLGGNPQNEYFATKYLVKSGEHAIPPLVRALLDPLQSQLWPRIIPALTKMGKPAVTPLAIALRMRDNDVRVHLIRALGEIGYPHAIPYLRKVNVAENMPESTRSAAVEAIQRIESIAGRPIPGEDPELFYSLAESYYNEDEAVRADPRLDEANVWYWDDARQSLEATVVPVRIFGQVMAMRCCEEALRMRNDHAGAIALWLASNIRRESRLGMNVESGDAGEAGDVDNTRPGVFPRSLYFTQAAGARYAHLVLGRATKDQDSAVALGAIEALRVTAGDASLVGTEDVKQPLVQALRFPDVMVRIRAALALGAALPKKPFEDSQFVVPVLADAITLTGREQILVVDPDENNLNRVAEVFRGRGRSVISAKGFYVGLERARNDFHSLTALVVSADIGAPGLGESIRQFRSEFIYSKTPVVVLRSRASAVRAEQVAGSDGNVELVEAGADGSALEAALGRGLAKSGISTITQDQAVGIAMEAIETLRRIAVDGRTVYELGAAEHALVTALSFPDEGLQTAAASVLALVGTSSAQGAVAALALDDGNSDSLRVAGYHSLSESAKNHGNLLGQDQIDLLVDISRDATDLTIRTAASQALGAINLQSNKASEIIRAYYGG